MSIAYKKNQYKTQIRRQNFNSIIQKKKQNYHLQHQVNQAFEHYLKTQNLKVIPKVCVFNFSYIKEKNKANFIEMVNSSGRYFNFAKPQNISFFTKLMFKNKYINHKMFKQITELAQKLLYSLISNQNLIFGSSQTENKFCVPNSQLFEDIICFPNCLIQYWAIYLSYTRSNIPIESYCTIYKSFKYWFGQNSNINLSKYLNKYSICFFVNQISKSQQQFHTQEVLPIYKQVQELQISFQTISIKNIGRLINQGYFSLEILQNLTTIFNNTEKSYVDLLLKQIKVVQNIYQLIILGIQNQNYCIKQDQGLRSNFFCYGSNGNNNDQLQSCLNVNQQLFQTIKKLSIEEITFKNENVGQKIGKMKSLALDLLHEIIISQFFQDKFLRSQLFSQILKLLYKEYIYAQNIKIKKIQIQKSISVILTNITMLVSNLLYLDESDDIYKNCSCCLIDNSKNEQVSSLQCQNEGQDDKKSLQIESLFYHNQESKNTNYSSQIRICQHCTTQFQFERQSFSAQQKKKIIKKYKHFIKQQIDVVMFIEKTHFKVHDKIVDFIELLKQFSQFVDQKEFDYLIFQDGKLARKIVQVICFEQENCFNQQQKKHILSCLIDFMDVLDQKQFDFRRIPQEIQLLTQYQILDMLAQDHQDLHNFIIRTWSKIEQRIYIQSQPII